MDIEAKRMARVYSVEGSLVLKNMNASKVVFNDCSLSYPMASYHCENSCTSSLGLIETLAVDQSLTIDEVSYTALLDLKATEISVTDSYGHVFSTVSFNSSYRLAIDRSSNFSINRQNVILCHTA